MRVLLLADVHANWEALLTLQRAEPEPEAVLFAGDAVGYGPDPSNCARWLLANATAAARGNHEEALARGEIRGVPAELEEAGRETLTYSRACLSPGDLDGLRDWPASVSIVLGCTRFLLAHATPSDPFAGQVNPATCPEAEARSLFDGTSADVIVLGHTHVPSIRRVGERLIVNPGSLGQPRYGVPDPTYAVWDDGEVRISHLHYEHEATARKLRLAPFSPEVAEQLSAILETGLA